MDDILNTIGETIGGFFASPIVQGSIQAIAIYFVILWLAAAYWAFRDMQLRTQHPILPYLAASAIIIFTPVFFPFAVFGAPRRSTRRRRAAQRPRPPSRSAA